MRSIKREPNIDAELKKAADYPTTAAVAYTPMALATLLAEKLHQGLIEMCGDRHHRPVAHTLRAD